VFHLGGASLQVELDAFSGRPNPRWELTGADAAEFAKRLRELQPLQRPADIFEGLGYRGFIIRADREPVNGYEEVRLYRGIVMAKRGNQQDAFNDANRALERWLFDSARGHVDEAVLQFVGTELAR
jgi:hypothetical protein